LQKSVQEPDVARVIRVPSSLGLGRVQERDKVGGVIAGGKFIGSDITEMDVSGEAAYTLYNAEECTTDFLEEVAGLAASLKLIVPAEVAGGNEIVNMVAAASWSGEHNGN